MLDFDSKRNKLHTDEKQNVLGSWVVKVFSQIFDQRRYTWLLPIIVLTYWMVYDGMEHKTISEVYSEDKYGVVFVYAVVAVLTAAENWVSLGLTMSVRNSMLMRMVFGATALKVLFCALIFKHHTSDDVVQKNLHLVFVGGLAVVFLCSLRVMRLAPSKRIDNVKDKPSRLRTFDNLENMHFRSCHCHLFVIGGEGAAFLVLSHFICPSYDFWWTRGLSVLFEALALADTIMY